MRQLPVKSHDRSEGVTFRDQTQFSWREVVALTMVVHLRLLNRFEVVFQ